MDWKIYRFNRYNGSNKLVAFVDLMIDDKLVIKGWRLINGVNGLFLANPSDQGKDGKNWDTVFFQVPLDKKEVEDMVIAYYKGENQKPKEEV
jgi:DNA-binding cell septation regulator SpoVG